MERTTFNYGAIVLAASASSALSFVWFTLLFREPYLAGLGRSQAQLDQGPPVWGASVLQFLGYMAMVHVTAWLAARANLHTVVQGLSLGALLWLGFVAAVLGPMFAFQAFSLRFFAICSGCPLLCLLVIAVTAALSTRASAAAGTSNARVEERAAGCSWRAEQEGAEE
jgi:hypothetical protein